MCPTFARVSLLEEAVESFLRQDYAGDKELVVCNDFPLQKLAFEHPQVKVVNLDQREPTLGHKRNRAYSYATGDFFLTWGDDDIHLASRISRMVRFVEKESSEFAFEGPFYCIHHDHIVLQKGRSQGAHIISSDLFRRAGGIPLMDMGEDAEFNLRVEKALGRPLPVNPADPQFVYRWAGTRRIHISGLGFDKAGKTKGYQVMLDRALELVRLGEEPSGRVYLNPHWSKDWTQEVKKTTAT